MKCQFCNQELPDGAKFCSKCSKQIVCKECEETFANDLKKMQPRLPLVDDVRDFWAFSKAGRLLADLHLNYEKVEPYRGVLVLYNPLSISDTLSQAGKQEIEYLNYKVGKKRFSKKGKDKPLSTIIR